MENWSIREEDNKVLRDIQSFIPEKVFDSHAHIYRVKDLNLNENNLFSEYTDEISINIWKKFQGQIFGNKRIKGGLFFPVPSVNANINNENAYLLEQLANHIDSRGLVLVHPKDSIKKISAYLQNKQIVGLKPYHIYSDENPTWESSIRGFLPEWMWKLANE